MQIHTNALCTWMTQAFPWQQWGLEGKEGSVNLQQMMDVRGDHLFVEQRQRFAVLTSPVGNRATQSTVIDAAHAWQHEQRLETWKKTSLKTHGWLFMILLEVGVGVLKRMQPLEWDRFISQIHSLIHASYIHPLQPYFRHALDFFLLSHYIFL